MSTREAFIAANRFGLGARPGELAEIAADPRGWVEQQLLGPDSATPVLATIEATSTRLVEAAAHIRAATSEDASLRKKSAEEQIASFTSDMSARILNQATSEHPFRERWIAAWSNHFTVSIARRQIAILCGPYERDAIRPSVTATFGDLLAAATLHPAMQVYLDNVRSIGPDSVVGRRAGKGLNENLARELLELHTLGVDGGYTQDDVQELAKILTGWSLDRDGAGGPALAFHDARHQPGSKTLLGTTIPEGGAEETHAALRLLASHPATARNVARRLCRHFVADDPPQEAVAAVEKTFVDTDGDLKELARTIIRCDAAWEQPIGKIKTPNDVIASTARALRWNGGEGMLQSLRFLGQIPLSAPSPKGWSDAAADWVGPDQVLARVEIADEIASHRTSTDGVELAEDLLGPVLSDRTRDALRASGGQSVGVLLASPEFQRR
jgi:uncharacterized protein (DUF1800 family)